ncbi:DNA internalization-related competence protein ComEC/Rec2 [Thalassotalea agariperforans]
MVPQTAITMDRWLLTFFLGALLSLFLPIVPEISYVIFLTVLALACSLLKLSRQLVAFILGCIWMLFNGANYNQALNNNSITSEQLYQKSVILTGEIDNLIIPNLSTTRINVNVEAVNHIPLIKKIKVRLSWQSAPKNLQQGQRWQLAVKLKPAHGLANQGGFSYQTWLRQHQLVASGYVKKQQAQLISEHTSLRQRGFDHIFHRVKEKNGYPLYLALTFGVRDSLTKDDWQILALTGTQHLLAISGLHIGLIAGASYYLLLFLLRVLPVQYLPSRGQRLLNQHNLHYLVIIFSVLCAFFYSYLAGFSAPTSRALIMLSLFWLSKCLRIKLSKTRLVLLTLFFILLLQPMSILGAGFWLSFYAVMIIFFIHWAWQHIFERFARWQKYLASLLLIQFGLTLFILPVAALLQNQLPSAAILANILAVPFMSLVVLPLVFCSAVLALFTDIDFVVELAMQTLSILWQWLSLFKSVEESLIVVSDQAIMLLMVTLFCVVFVYLATNRKKASWVVALLVPIFLIAFSEHFRSHFNNEQNDYVKQWQVKIFDVGQGLAVIIQKNQRVILYDTGASYPSGFVMAESVIAPYLKSQGINTIDKVIISHSDNDHAGGLTWLRQHFIIKQVIANDVNLAGDKPCLQGETFAWQGLQINQLWPLEPKLGSENDDSCVFTISDGVNQVLFTGDISQKVEQQLLASVGNQLSAAILIAPHHGSNTSSSSEFIKTVKPTYAVFSAGFMNQWQMPTEKVVTRYQELAIKTLKTADSGMISFYLTANSIDVLEYKKHQYAFWFAN